MNDEQVMLQIQRLLEEIRDNQKLQLEKQSESLEISKQQFAVFLQQHEKTKQLQDRAEALQARSASLVGGARKAFPVTIAIIVILLVYVTWLLWRFTVR